MDYLNSKGHQYWFVIVYVQVTQTYEGPCIDHIVSFWPNLQEKGVLNKARTKVPIGLCIAGI